MPNTRRNGFVSAMISSQVIEWNQMDISYYTKGRIPDVLLFVRNGKPLGPGAFASIPRCISRKQSA